MPLSQQNHVYIDPGDDTSHDVLRKPASVTQPSAALTAEQFYREVWLKGADDDDPRGDWPIRFADAYTADLRAQLPAQKRLRTELRREIAEAIRVRQAAEDQLASAREEIAGLKRAFVAVMDQVRLLREKFLKYAEHLPLCESIRKLGYGPHHCNCGLAEAIAALDPAKAAPDV